MCQTSSKVCTENLFIKTKENHLKEVSVQFSTKIKVEWFYKTKEKQP